MKEEVSQGLQPAGNLEPADTSQATQELPQEKQPKKKPQKWLIVFLIVLALAALVVAGIFAYRYLQLKKSVTPEKAAPATPSSPTVSLLPTGAPSPTPIADPSADWFSYGGDDFCYTFKYPKELTLKVRQEEKIVHLSLWGPTQKEDTEFYDGISLSFSFPLELGGTSLKDYVDSQIEESKETGEILKPRETIAINGINGYTYTVSGLGTFKNIYLQSPDQTCTFEITDASNDPTNQGYQETVDQILSTLKIK